MQRPQQQQQQPEENYLTQHDDGTGGGCDEEILFTDDDFNVRQPIVDKYSSSNDHHHQQEEDVPEQEDMEEVALFSGDSASSPLRPTTTTTQTSGTMFLPNNISNATALSSPFASSSYSSTAQRRNNNNNNTPTNKRTTPSPSSSSLAVLKRADFRLQQQTRLGNNTPQRSLQSQSQQQQQQQQQQQVLSTFDPYKSPRGLGRAGQPLAGANAAAVAAESSLLDSSVEEEEYEDNVQHGGGGGLAFSSMIRNSSSIINHGGGEFLEMETPSMDYGEDNPDDHHHRPYPHSQSGSGSIHKQQYNNYYVPGDPIKTSSGLLLTHRRTPVPSSPPILPPAAVAGVVVTGHTPLFPHGSSGSSTSTNSMRQLQPNQQGQEYYGGNSSFSAFPNGNNNTTAVAGGKTFSMIRRFEVENPWNNNSSSSSHGSANNGDSFLRQAKRMLSFVRVWVVLSAIILLVGTAIVLHHLRQGASHESSTTTSTSRISSSSSSSSSLFQLQQQQDGSRLVVPVTAMNNNGKHQQQQLSYDYGESTTDRVVLLPLSPEMIQQQQEQQQRKNNHHQQQHIPGHRVLKELRSEFEDWMQHHGKHYHSHAEKEERFSIWARNHEQTRLKNQQHGPCKLTGQPVFGSNHFKDLTPEEFQDVYLNSKKPRPREEERRRTAATATATVLKPPPPVQQEQDVENHNNELTEESLPTQPIHHPEVHRRIQERWNSPRVKSYASSSSSSKKFNCSWWDISCILQYIFEKFVYGFYGIGTTMEPAYDADSYPTAVDWRDVGAVTEVRTQDGCGACWAITAVETAESGNFLSYGVLYDLSETEVIVCSSDCEMCDGGWPEEAFDYIMEHNGVPLSKDMSYDGNWLLAVSNSRSGASDTLDSSTLKAYMSATCPSNGGGGGGNSKSGSNDRNNNQDYGGNDDGAYGFTQNSYSRYGNIKGYGYGTERCVCYTDGTGCDCDDQDEGLAVGNLATYGPAVVCVDASDWQDYGGGIITSSSGCSAKFLDVNHCVQVVGYAFASDTGNDNNNNNNNGNSGSGSGSGSGSQDDEDRQGYWIVRNQWSTYWGMNGYAYVAMGDNTCGILNNMIQVYNK